MERGTSEIDYRVLICPAKALQGSPNQLHYASSFFPAFILFFRKNPRPRRSAFTYLPWPGTGSLPGGMETSARECRVPSRSGAATGAMHPGRSGRSGWSACPKAGDAESDVVVLVGRIVVVAVRGLQVVVVVVERAAPQPAVTGVPAPQSSMSRKMSRRRR